MKSTKNIESTWIPASYYVSITQAAEYLNLSKSSIAYHIKEGHLKTIHMPGLGHHIREKDVLDFIPMPPGKPSVYTKVIK